MDRIANFIFDRAKVIILAVVILNIVAAASFIRFGLDTDFLSFFTAGNPKAVEYGQLNDKYQTGESISILVEQDVSLLQEQSLIDVLRIQELVAALDGVGRAQSFIPPEVPVQGLAVPVDEEFIGRNYELVRDFIENKYFMTDQFLAPSGQQGVIVVTLASDAESGVVVDSLKDIVQDQSGLTLSLAGNEIIKDTLWGYLMRVFVLMPFAIIVVLLVFFLVLRVRRFTILAFVPAALAALWIFGTVFWSGRELNIVTVLTPMFILAMGSAFGLHFVSHFSDNMRTYQDRRQLIVETMRMVGTPIFLAAITTMAGFASLTWTNVLPMREMGIFVTIGIGYAAVLALVFVPAVLSRVRLPSSTPAPGQSRLTGLVLATSRRRVPIVIVFTAIVIASAVYIPGLGVESDQLMFFKEDSDIRKSFAKVEESFGGAIPLTGEIVSPDGVSDLNDYEFASKVLATERELETLPGIKSVFSILDLVKGINKAATGQDVYPQNPMMIQGILMQIGPDQLPTWVSGDGMRMTIRTQDFDSDYIGGLEGFVAEHGDTVRIITGMPVLFDEMNRLVVESQIKSLGLALILIFIMLLVTMRRVGAALAGMLPIAITIAAILGMLSLARFELNIMTANLSAICIGVGVDYAIHVISGIYYFRRTGLDDRRSVDHALSTVSKPVLANAFGLAIGLSVLFFSPLRLHIHAASVMWVAMVVSSLAALLLIPIFYRRRKEIAEGSEPSL
jgi:predicted RND superfamily exporter protein